MIFGSWTHSSRIRQHWEKLRIVLHIDRVEMDHSEQIDRTVDWHRHQHTADSCYGSINDLVPLCPLWVGSV